MGKFLHHCLILGESACLKTPGLHTVVKSAAEVLVASFYVKGHAGSEIPSTYSVVKPSVHYRLSSSFPKLCMRSCIGNHKKIIYGNDYPR